MSVASVPASVPASGSSFARLRAEEYGYLDRKGHVYLDHTGAGLPAESQLTAHAARITGDCFGNPHSENPTAAASDRLVAETRAAVLRHLNADPEEYAAVFTANASGACRVVGEAYRFGRGSRLVLPLDNHNSVNGLREFARAKGARTVYVPFDGPELRISEEALLRSLSPRSRRRPGLLAYPAQSNFTGVQHPLEWIAAAQQRGYDVLLDAAAYLPSNALDLSRVRPDFVTVSWYKVFGYPTGIGCLVARRGALAGLRRPWFSGGTIQVVSAQGEWHRMTDDETAFEDGTLNFLSIPDVATGLAHVRGIGIDAIHEHVMGLTAGLLEGLRALRHGNGAPMVRLYGPETTERRGGSVTLNVLAPDGAVVDERIVSRESSARGISLRTGCFCNPGAGEGAFGIPRRLLAGAVRRTTGTIDDYLSRLGLPSGGAVRVSLGLSSNQADVDAFLGFLADSYRDRRVGDEQLSPRLRC
ncbi:aminotransferase class V-fold PLP-dependent enzyme [Streptacidiphilus carbonis]|uniref:aminotransferase class V-fold PLP-dependent enzyme n=1 Tax=Streptacidiphilus carbonis TaxID=105422 RepID=UPI0005AB8A8D|nr:aminotransferase class V-fold PLP-dependent enzyme [Streptacidiphilus carbonis]